MEPNLLTAKKNLYKYHVAGLALIGIIVLSFLFAFEFFARNQAENSSAINTAGRQRMLSQQIALYANLYVSALSNNIKPENNADNLAKLQSATNLFESSHEELTRSDKGDQPASVAYKAAYDLYFESPANLDAEVRNYISHARKIIDTRNDIQQRRIALNNLNDLTRNSILQKLDLVVQRVESNDNQQALLLLSIERVSAATIILLIILEITLLLRPVYAHLQKSFEQAEETSETLRFLELVGNVIPDLLFVKDSKFRIVRGNTAFLSLYPPEKRDHIIGHTTFEEFLPEEAEGFLANDKKAFELGESSTEENLSPSSSPRRTFFTRKVRFEMKGEQYILGISRDITTLKNAQYALKRSESQFRETFENCPVGMAIVGMDGKWLRVNKSICKILGYDEEKLLSTDFQTITHAEDLNKDLENLKALVAGKIQYYHMEKRYIHKNGSVIWALLSVSMVRDSNQENSFFISQILDISAQKKLFRELESANSELEEFAYRTSHDLRSPLVSSLGVLRLAKNSLMSDKTDEALESINYAEKGLLKLEALIKDILVLTQNNSQQEPLAQVDVEDTIRASIENLKYMDGFERPEINIRVAGPKYFETQKTKFSSIVENLLSNALKYQDRSKEKSFINISVYYQSDNLVLVVEDNGLGIPKENQSKIFRMFERFHTRVAFGSGLGLHILKKTAEKLGGTVGYKDTGTGSAFSVKLPLKYIAPNQDISA